MTWGKNLADILAPVGSFETRGNLDLNISGICYDSNAVTPGTLFCCIAGSKDDGHRYLPQAVTKGAIAAIVSEFQDVGEGVVQVKVSDPRRAMALAASEFYGRPSDSLKIFGVTGTNGKTTSTYLLNSILRAAGQITGLIGTIETKIGDEVLTSIRTTPESVDLQRLLRQMLDRGVQAVVMEVSSHAVKLDRHVGCRFDAVAFTNLTQDHLDFHSTMEEYYSAKKILFTDSSAHKPALSAVINIDDPWGARLASSLTYPAVTLGLSAQCQVRAEILSVSPTGSRFELVWPDGKALVELPLTGRVNIYNALTAAALALSTGIAPDVVALGLSSASGVPGRLESIDCGQPFKVMVDYAHTPDGLRAVLGSVREISHGRIITVFGCGGDRDREKRPLMGGIAGQLSDVTIVTSDNPRSEDPLEIISEIKSGMNGSTYSVIADRRDAIAMALAAAHEDDLVLIAGKGHEGGQTIGDTVVPFDDREVAREELERLGWS